MSPETILGVLVGLPVVILVLLRVNASLVFLSLCLGDVLVRFVAPDTNSIASLFTKNNFSTTTPNNRTITLIILLLPVLLTTVFMIRTVKGKFRLLVNILPAIGVGLLGALLVVPLLSAGLSHNILNSSLWLQVTRAQDLIVGMSAVVCLFVLWVQRPKSGGEGKKGKHKG